MNIGGGGGKERWEGNTDKGKRLVRLVLGRVLVWGEVSRGGSMRGTPVSQYCKGSGRGRGFFCLPEPGRVFDAG